MSPSVRQTDMKTMRLESEADFDLDSLQEKISEKEPSNNPPAKPQPEKNNDNLNLMIYDNNSKTLKIVLIAGAIIGSLILIIFVFYFWKKNSGKK